jgi:Zn-dependent M28 family amino/carboxypeptidase
MTEFEFEFEFESGTDWVGETFVDDTGPAMHEELVDIGNRLSGTEGERRAATAIRNALDDAGVRDARTEAFDIQGWERGHSAVEVDGESFGSVALPRSPSATVSGELVDLGYGLPADFEDVDLSGKVVIVDTNVPPYHDRFVHRTEKYYYAVEGGAAAFLFRNHVPGDLPPTGSVGRPGEPIGEIPAVGVSKEGGARLARRHEGEAVTVEVEATIGDARSRNVLGELGPETDRTVLVTAHYDGHDIAEAAVDNGAGTAVLVGTAAALARREGDLQTRVRLVAVGGEEVGLLGAEHVAETTDLETVKAVLNADGPGRARDYRVLTNYFDELGAAAERAGERLRQPVEAVPTVGPHSDHWPFVKRGVPGLHLRSVEGNEGRGWGHTHADTYDKVDPRDIRTHAIVTAGITAEVARDAVDPDSKSEAEIAGYLEDEDLATGMKIIGSWPYDEGV